MAKPTADWKETCPTTVSVPRATSDPQAAGKEGAERKADTPKRLLGCHGVTTDVCQPGTSVSTSTDRWGHAAELWGSCVQILNRPHAPSLSGDSLASILLHPFH